MARTRRNRWVTVASAVAALAAAQVAVGLADIDSARAAPVTGVQLVTAASSYSSSFSKIVTSTCPPGKVALGGGGRVVDGDGYVFLTGMEPGPNTFKATALEQAVGHGGAWSLRAYVVCSDPVPGWELVQYQEWSPAGAREHQARVSCTAGRRVLGAGALVDFGVDTTLQWVRPGEQNGTGFVVAAGVADIIDPFRLTAYAVCADAPNGYEISATGTAGYTGRLLQVSTQCTGNRKLLGAGLTKVDGNGTSRVDGIFPISDLRTVWTVSRQPAANNRIHLGAWAICAD
jgi:hypothetical protein